jgi:hypothetical protein
MEYVEYVPRDYSDAREAAALYARITQYSFLSGRQSVRGDRIHGGLPFTVPVGPGAAIE